MAFNGLLPHIKDKYASQEFESISQIAARMSGETRSYESKKPFQKKINYVEYYANDDSEEEQETVASAEWIQNSKKWRVQRQRQLEIIEEEQKQTMSKKGVKSQVWRVKAKADDESASNSSTPIQAVGSLESSWWMSS